MDENLHILQEKQLLFILATLLCCLHDNGGVGSDRVSVSVTEGDSVTLYSGVKTNQQENIVWYFNDVRIAQINQDLNKSCTDVQCNENTDKFRGRLKLDHQTGSLTIMNTRSTDAGNYHLEIVSSGGYSVKTFGVTVYDVSAANQKETKSVKEGESVTLNLGGMKKPDDLMMYFFNDALIAKVTGGQICTDVQFDERFSGRLKLDRQTGSLTIIDSRITDSGVYKLEIINISSITVTKGITVTITGMMVGDPVTLETPAVDKVSVSIAVGFCVIFVLLLLVDHLFCRQQKSKYHILSSKSKIQSFIASSNHQGLPHALKCESVLCFRFIWA
ncbi:uncharacterized protein isoform X2 [Danio rerio]|uniref:Uncharacterized protein isoform X2 n=1 Tax=Danio rerio TaxID=7955 RepID=A0AB32TFM8_DANRE